MPRSLRLTLLTLAILAGSAHTQPPPLVAPTKHLPPEQEAAAFKLPPGFSAQLVAAEPDIQKPMNMAFDAKGRLWVTDTVEYPWPVADGKPGRDRVVILSDFGDDGKARKKTVFADGLNIPIGVLPLPSGDECIVYSIPYVWHMKDTDGDGKADVRKQLYGLFGTRDTHGMVSSLTLGLDGWVYACHGFANDSTVKGADGQELKMNSGNTWRFRPDGSHCEQYSRGQVNPFGMTVDPFGFLYTADCHSRPMTQVMRGATYTSFSKPHDGLGFAPSMIGHEHNSTGLCGLVYYDADYYPQAYRGQMFLGNVVTNRINLDNIEFAGSSPKAIEQPDFLASGDYWTRPVDLKLGPDGAIYFADFYNKIIGHYEVDLRHPERDRTSGRIWRIVRDQAPKMPRADWTKATPAELVADLGHPNLVVRYTATHQLVARGESVAAMVSKAIEEPRNPLQAAHGLWVLERLGKLDDAVIARAAKGEPVVAAHALRILGERQAVTDEQRDLFAVALAKGDRRVARIAAEGLGRHPEPKYINALLQSYHATPADDTHLRYAIKVALRDLLKSRPEAFDAADRGTPANRVLLTEVSFAVPTNDAALSLAGGIDKLEADAGRERFAEAIRHVARYGKADAVGTAVDFVAGGKLSAESRLAGFQALQRGFQEAGKPTPAEVIAQAEQVARHSLDAQDAKQVQAGIELAGSFRLPGLREPLAALASDASRPEGQRIATLPALAAVDAGKAVPVLAKLLTAPAEPFPLREGAARALAGTNLPAAREALLGAMATVPGRLAVTMAAELALTPQGAEALLVAVSNGKASPRLLQERIVEQRLNERKLPNLAKRIADLTAGLPSADQKMLALMKSRGESFRAAKPDREAGVKLFAKNCAACHQLAGQGAKIGPALDGIGNRGLERLLEDVLDPSRNVDQALRTTVVELKNGTVVSGLVLREEGEVLVLADAMGKEVRIPKNTVEGKTTSLLSPMPANFAEQVSEAEFHHLIAFLLEQRAEPMKK